MSCVAADPTVAPAPAPARPNSAAAPNPSANTGPIPGSSKVAATTVICSLEGLSLQVRVRPTTRIFVGYRSETGLLIPSDSTRTESAQLFARKLWVWTTRNKAKWIGDGPNHQLEAPIGAVSSPGLNVESVDHELGSWPIGLVHDSLGISGK